MEDLHRPWRLKERAKVKASVHTATGIKGFLVSERDLMSSGGCLSNLRVDCHCWHGNRTRKAYRAWQRSHCITTSAEEIYCPGPQ